MHSNDHTIKKRPTKKGRGSMFRLGQKVIIVHDQLEQGLPLGQHGYIIAYERNQDNVFDYLMRIPSINKHMFVVESDIASEETLYRVAAEQLEKEVLIDYALKTWNKQLFDALVKKEDEANVETVPLSRSEAQFVRQINLRAWI
jgi:hypothetical protein